MVDCYTGLSCYDYIEDFQKPPRKRWFFACLQIVAYNIPSDDRRMLSYIMVRGGDAPDALISRGQLEELINYLLAQYR